ncbi:MAG: IS5 family transposase [Acidobacteriota bacterium]
MHHHKRDWINYNKQLVNRGKIHFWIRPDTQWKGPRNKKNGHPFVYADEAIKAMLYIRFKFHLSLRELEGFFISLMEICQRIQKVPCYTQVCRRMKTLSLPQKLLEKRAVTDIVLDTTGLKVYGAGEWRAKRYGGKARWRKLHLAMDLKTGKLTIAEVTDEYKHDTTYLEKALKEGNTKKGKILVDGIADSGRCYELAQKHNKELITPPKRGAVLRKEEGYKKRNEAIKIIRGLGGDELARSIWGKLVGYNRRVEIESMIARWKGLYGGDLKSRTEERIIKEVKIKALMINEMIIREKVA